VILSYRYRLLPTRAQHRALGEILEEQRRLYNDALAERIDAYRRSVLEVERGRRAKPQTITFFGQTNSLTTIRNDPLTREEFSRLPAFLQQWTLKRLDDAYKAFFRRVRGGIERPGFPRFRGRDYWSSFGSTVQSGNSPVSFDGRRVRISSRLWQLRVRVHCHRPLPDDTVLKAAVFTRAAGGRKWHVSLQCEVGQPAPHCQSHSAAIGLDLGITAAIMQSDGTAIGLPGAIRTMRKAERRAARALARARRGSKRRGKTRARFAKIKAKVAAVRKQWAHKQAARLTRSYALIAAEDLTVGNMTRSAKGTIEAPGSNVRAKAGLNREILTTGWAQLREMLAYKAARDGARLVLVDPRNTSQRCSGCKELVRKTLAQRTHHCPHCGLILDRDENAAKNVLSLALAGDTGRPVRGDGNGRIAARRLGNTAASMRQPDGDGYAVTPTTIRSPATSARKPADKSLILRAARAVRSQ
jgi:putative transposase